MLRTIVALTCVVLKASTATGQTCAPAVAARGQEDVKLIVQSLYAGDVDVVLKYTHPAVIKMQGGQDAARRAVTAAVALLQKNSMKLESLSFPAEPTCFAGTSRQFIIVPTLSVIEAGGQRFESLNFQLGASESSDGRWTYVEGSRVNAENVQVLFPGFPRDYRFPPIYRKRL